MLRASYTPMLTDQDQLIFVTLVPPNHYLRQVNAVVDFECYRATMATCYHATDGRPADDPVVLLKVGFLQTHHNLSDREVVAQAPVSVAFHYFLNAQGYSRNHWWVFHAFYESRLLVTAQIAL